MSVSTSHDHRSSKSPTSIHEFTMPKAPVGRARWLIAIVILPAWGMALASFVPVPAMPPLLNEWVAGVTLLLGSGIGLVSIVPVTSVSRRVDRYISGNRSVTVEVFEPRPTGQRAALLLLHGLDGMESGGPCYRLVAERLARKGYVVFLPHYFDRTGTTPADLPSLLEQFRGFLGVPGVNAEPTVDVPEIFTVWLEAIRDALDHAREYPGVDPERVGLVGFSMGGFLSTATATASELNLRCVVELFGGLPRPLADQVDEMPPTLIVHGDADDIVPVSEAQTLQTLLRSARRACEAKVYKGVGHCFLHRNGKVNRLACLFAEKRVLSFLSRNLTSGESYLERPEPTNSRFSLSSAMHGLRLIG